MLCLLYLVKEADFMEYKFGVLVGIIAGLLVGIALVALLFHKKVLDMHFDERQELARGKAYQYGFFTLLSCLFAYGVSDLALGRWCDALAGVTFCAAAGLGVFAVTCILKDAYLGLREKPRQVMIMFALIAIINLGFGFMSCISGGLVENGVLTFRAVNPILGAEVLVILIVYMVNHLLRNQRDAE